MKTDMIKVNDVKNNKVSVFLTVGTFLSFGLIGLITTLFFSPIVKTNAANTATVTATAVVNSVITITSSDSVALGSVSPTESGQFISNTASVTATTNSTAGYKLYIKANTSDVNLTSASTDTPITPCSANVTSSTMVKDTWGYSTDGSAYNPLTTSDVQIKNWDGSGTDSAKTVYFGAKISTATKSGTYTNVVKFTGIPN